MNAKQEQSALHDRIAHARARRTFGRRSLLLGLGGIVLLAAAVGGGIWIGLPAARHAPPDESVRQAAPAPGPDTESASAESGDVSSPVSKTATPASEPLSPAQRPDAAEARRAQFQTMARDFARTREVELARIQSAPVPGPRAARARIALNAEKALSAYDDGDVDSALRLLGDAEREAADVLREAKAHYRHTVHAAKAAYAAGDAETARLRIARARAQWPDEADAKLWETRIAQLPALLAERENVKHARAAGDLRAEQAALRRIVELDSTDADAAARIPAIDGQLRDRAFTRAVALGWRAIDDADPKQAAQALADAERLQPRHADTLRLKTRLAAFTRVKARDRHLAAAAQAAARDDWPGASRAFEQARVLAPTHAAAVDGSRLAARVTAAQKAVDDWLARPERLRSPPVAEAARKTLRDAAPLMTRSPRLTAGHAALARAIEDRQTPVSVRVLSDNQTEIGIRGVGLIGRTEHHVIELRPGAYVFEGKRKGYRSKLVAVEVPNTDGASAEVRIVCDERI